VTALLIIAGLLMALTGLLGCILPAIPGPPISFLSLLVLSFAKDWEPFNATFLVIMAGITALLTLSDYVLPTLFAEKYGASRSGIWGSVAGMLVGVLLFPPWGVLLGAFVGAIIGELIAGKMGKTALLIGWGVLVGNMVSIGFKLSFSGFVLVVYIMNMF